MPPSIASATAVANIKAVAAAAAAVAAAVHTTASSTNILTSKSHNTMKGLFPPKKNASTVQYHCTHCMFACTWKYDLKLHLKQKHGIHKK